MSLDPNEINVLVPDPDGMGVIVTDLAQLMSRYDEEETLTELLTNAAFDSTFTDEAAVAKIARVRELNRTGDASVYWASYRDE